MNIRPPHSLRSILDAMVGRWLRGDRASEPETRPEQWIPRVRTLEPRIVLNATAELAALGDLVISGDAADDFVEVSIDGSGRIELFDANSAVIPIRVGTDAFGNPIFVDSVHPSQITTGRLTTNLGAGNDTLRIDVPVDLSVTVIDDLGNDSVDVTLTPDNLGVSDNVLNIDAETISLNGRDNDIDLTSSKLESSGTNGSISIENADDVTLGNVTVNQGRLQIGDAADLITGNVTQAGGTDIAVNRLEINATEGVDLSQADNSIAIVDDISTDGDVILRSDASGLANDTMVIHRIETLDNSVRGDISVTVNGSVDLVSSDPANDTVLSTANGEIRVSATEDLRIDDFVSSNDGSDVAADHEIIAGGTNGRVNLSAGDTWTAGDAVQIYASQITDGAVTINAPDVVIGNDFEINTGNGVGIAHRFAPRPEINVIEPGIFEAVQPGVITDPNDPDFVEIETAFYDVDSISTNILTQANENDATGVLSVQIGVAGENGLTLSIDWGGQSNRFQTLENLPGDRTQVDVAHVYTQADILNSTLNGRISATAPLAVRFAVSHHASIVITGDSIEQTVAPGEIVTAGGTSLSEAVPGQLLTSTDNPNTVSTFQGNVVPDYESGRAFFVIPRVDLPPAFFAVRNVIPEPIDPPPPFILTSTTELSNVTFETAEASASPLSIREEYFQLRTLSPDPQGDDLVEPIRLHDNIMSQEHLTDLFTELPDGSYEIQYVIGESDQRTILRVDLRGGEAVILSDDIESGSMELELLESEESDGETDTGLAPKEDDHEPRS
ncbi:hypothetical protein FHS27_000279 [Rhodopirellula rubra]|uniref:Uncharacterized protein n=1 Tax=Aporhodopirellula rubra TaxID=980271 RepID=A0A7W5DUB4_9BACT|nr:hypothetical protein [Aporhodopirellula rubra]MBB3204515.1 hypothetical protein [Aporhodopirellula rubra]